MYILELNYGDGEIHRHFLLPDQTYTLGRKTCRILLPVAEPSISRHHATIFVAPMPRYSVLDPSAQLEIRIEDVSKHGTFVDRERIGKGNSRFLYPEDRIRLGLRVTARIIPVMLVLAISPDLTDASLDLVLDACVHVGALVVEDSIPAPLSYYEQHINCIGFLYVAEDSFRMEETMMTALGHGYTLVTPQYIANLVRSLEKKSTLMPGEFPSPSSPLPASHTLRGVHYRPPAHTFFSVTEFLSIGRPMMAEIFRDRTFVLLESALGETYSEVLRLFGGTVEAVALDAVAAWRSRQSSSPPFPLTTVVLVGEADFRSVSEEVIERGGGRGLFSTEHARPVICGYLTMYKYGVCLIPEENVHLALYRNDLKELNAKPGSCYLQRTADDLLADAAPSSADAAPLLGRSGTFTGSSSASRRGSTTRVSESPANASPSPAATIDPAPVLARRSCEPSFNAGYSPSRADEDGNSPAAARPATAAPTTATANSTGDVRSCDGSRGASPNPPSSLHSVHSAGKASAAREKSLNSVSAGPSPYTAAPATTSVAAVPPSAHLKGASHAQDTATSSTQSLLTSVATTASSSACAGGGSGATTAFRCGDRPASATSATTATIAPSAASAPQRLRVNTARRNSHPFSLSARQRDGGEEGDDEECTNNGTGGVLEPEEAEGSHLHRRGAASLTRRSRGGLRRSSIDNTNTMLPLKSEGVVRLLSYTGSASQPPGAAAAGSARGHQASTALDEQPQRRPHVSSEERRCNSARGVWRRCSNIEDTESSASNGAVPPLTSSSSTSLATVGPTGNTTAAVVVLHRAGQPKSVPAPTAPVVAAPAGEPAPSTRKHTERMNGNAIGKGSEAAHPPLSIRRGEQRLVSAPASAPCGGFARLNSFLDLVRSGSYHDTERCTTLEHDVVVHTASKVGVSPPRQRVEAVRIGSASGRRMPLSRDFERSLSSHVEPAEGSVDDMGNLRSVVRCESLYNGNRQLPGTTARPVSARRASSSFQRCDSSQMREMPTPRRLMTPRLPSSVPRSRATQAQGSAQRSWSQLATDDGTTHKTSIGAVREGRTGGASARRGSIQRRRGSPTQGNGASCAATTSSNLSVAAPVPGLRNGSATSARATTNNVTVESYLQMNRELHSRCQRFMSNFLDNFVSDAERTARCVVRQTYMDSPSKQMLEDGMERVLEFVYYVNGTYPDIPAMYSTTSTRAACQQVWQKSHYALSKIKSCYKTVNCKVPSVLTRACAALSTRTVPLPHQRRLTSVTARAEAGPSQRMSAF
ncbi:FHA domain containing protein, putative [Leishmania donovani]|uniref:FHA domain containing protein, putative n=1 Tax=Leishmania donovani TaxID=5661 RepID=A0A3S7WTU2_LEIDO|nr:FHA domain containing protein, putative [Leishmania donovani]